VVAVLAGLGVAFPQRLIQGDLWDGFFSRHYAGVRTAGRLFASAGVLSRHGVVNPLVEDVSAWGTGARMERYATAAPPLAYEAVSGALADAGLDPADVGLLAVASCTGYVTPGLDVRLAADLALPADTQRLLVGHMGCYAALPALGAVGDYVTARERAAVLLCVELTSLHVQPPDRAVDQVVAHALFSDAAAAVVLRPGGDGFRLRDVVARTDPSTADHMTWDVTDLGFRMGLSPRVPDVLEKYVGEVVDELLGRHGLAVPDVAGWAVHPGGPRIVDVVAEQLALPAAAVEASRQVLRDHGNCSSATVLLVLEELRPRVPVGGHVVLMAFGPGLTLYATLLTRTTG
jgi:predicted naringenin-chalcone synthase